MQAGAAMHIAAKCLHDSTVQQEAVMHKKMQQCMNKDSEEEEEACILVNMDINIFTLFFLLKIVFFETRNTLNTFVRPQRYTQYILAHTESKGNFCLFEMKSPPSSILLKSGCG